MSSPSVTAVIVTRDRPLIYLYHPMYQTAFTARLTGFRAMPDGIIRFQGVRLAPG